jgi:SAM-dependent methyltransferase
VDPFDPATVRRTYDRVADAYDAAFGHDLDRLDFDRRFLDDVGALVQGAGPVIDVGCGPGQVAAHLIAGGVRVVGVDLAPRMLDVARRRRNVVGVAADFRCLPVRDGSCAGVVAFYSLPFVRRHELVPVLRELRRVVRPDGILALAAHLGRGEVHGSDEWLGHAVDPIAATLFDEDELDAALSAAGFETGEVRHRDPLAHEHQGPRVYLWATATG